MYLSKLARSQNYLKSNSVFRVDFQPTQRTKLAAYKLLKVFNHSKRQVLGSNLLKNLSQDAGVSPVKLKISATRQWSKKKSGRTVFKLYGYYRSKSSYIYIQNLTSVRGKPVAVKTFLNTLIHEWLHHYDTQKLKLYSIHTKGFYFRLSSLKKGLNL